MITESPEVFTMTPREKLLLSRHLAKANPPPVLHRYRRACEWTIKELTVPEVHIASVNDMNDPFEYRAPLAMDLSKMKAAMYSFARTQRGMNHEEACREAELIGDAHRDMFRSGLEDLRAVSGLICCSSNPRSVRMWSYYGDAHKGVCVGYDAAYPPFFTAQKVNYCDPEGDIDLFAILKQDPTLLSDLMSCRKGLEWNFEEEFRIPVGPFPKDHNRLLPIQPAAIVEIRLGARISEAFKDEITRTVRALPVPPRMIQMACDFGHFQLTETIL